MSGYNEPRPFGFTPLAYFDSALAEWVDPGVDEIEWPDGPARVSSDGIAAEIAEREARDHEHRRREPTPMDGLQVLNARQVCGLPDPPASDELLGPLVFRRNRLVLGAHTGEGKTTMALQILRAIVEGVEFLDWRGAGGVRALVLDAEQGLRSVKRRLRESGLGGSEAVDVVRVPDGLALDRDAREIQEVASLLAAGDYAAVLLDPLYKLHSGDSNAERAAVDLMRRFDAWRDEFGFALILPVHLRKPIPGERFSIHDVFGSSAYTRGAEVVLGLRRVSNGFATLDFFKDRDGDLEVGARWGLIFDREQGFRRAPDDEEESEGAIAERLLEYVRQNPGESTTRVTTEVTGRKATLTRILRHDDRFRSERRGQAELWFEADAQHPFPGLGNGSERVAEAQDGQPVPRSGEPPFRGLTTGTGSSVAGPDEPEQGEELAWR